MNHSDFLPDKRGWKIIVLCGFFIGLFGLLILMESRIPVFFTAAPLFVLAMTYFVLGRPPKAEYCLYVLAAYLPFSKQLAYDSGYFPSPFSTIWILSAFILVPVWRDPVRRKKFFSKLAIHAPMMILWILGAVSVANGVIFGKARLGFAVYEFFRIWVIPYLLFLAVFHGLESRQTAKHMIWIMLSAVLMVSAMTIFEFLTAGNVNPDKSRAAGIANDPNILAVFLNIGMFISLGFFLRFWQKKTGWLFLIPFLGALRALLGTFSRGGYVSFVLGFPATCFFRKKILLIPILLGFGALILFPQLLPNSVRTRLGHTFKNPQQVLEQLSGQGAGVPTIQLDRSNRDRIEVWKGAVQMIKEHPVFGVGYTKFYTRISDYWYAKSPFEAHNTFLFIGAEMGIPAMIVFMWLCLAFFSAGLSFHWHAKHALDQALSAGFLGGLLSLLPSHLYVIRLDSLETAAYFWILAAMVMKLGQMRNFSSESLPENLKSPGAQG